MTDLSNYSDADLAQAAGLSVAPPTAPAVDGIHQYTDEELQHAAGVSPKTNDAPDGFWKAPSGAIMPEPGISQAVVAQFPFASDLTAAADALVRPGNFSDNFDAGRKDFWAANERYKENNPISDKVGQAIGLMVGLGKAPNPASAMANTSTGATQLATSGAAQAPGGGLLAQSARSAAVAAPVGATYGFGTSDGDLAERAKAAAIGGVTGGLVGAAAPSIANGLSAGTNMVRNWLGLGDPETVAATRLANSLQRDSLTPDDIAAKLAQFPDKPLTVADVAGNQNSATSRLARTVIDLPGTGSADASKFLTERDLGTGVNGEYDMFRQGGAADRIIGNIKSALGSDDAFQTATDLVAKQEADSAPLYDAFRAEPPTPARQIQPFMSSPTFRKALTRANNGALDSGQAPLTDLIEFNEAGDPTRITGGAFPPDTLNRIKQGIDDNWLAAKASGDKGAANDANNLRVRFVQFMDAKYPNTYPVARQAFAGPAVSLDAIADGTNVFNTAPQDVASTLAKLPPEAQDNFRLGVQQAMVSKVKNTSDGANEVAKIFGNPATRESVAAAFDDPQALNDLSQNLGMENRMTLTNKLGAGSRTAQSLADQSDFGSEMMRAGGEAAAHGVGHNPFGAAMRLVSPVLNRVTNRMGEQTTENLANMLLNPSNNAQTIDLLRNLPANQLRQKLAQSLMLSPAIRNTGAALSGEAQ